MRLVVKMIIQTLYKMRTFILFLFERCIAQWWHDNHVVFLTQINGGGWVGGRESTAAVPWCATCTSRPSRPLILGTYFHMATLEGLRSASPMPWATLFHRIFLGMWSWIKSERQRQGGGAASLEAHVCGTKFRNSSWKWGGYEWT